MPSPPDYALAHMMELMDHYAYVIVHGGGEDMDETECWKALQYFQKALPRHTWRSDYGRFANSVKLAEIAILVAVDYPEAKEGLPVKKEGKTNSGAVDDSDDEEEKEKDGNDIHLAAESQALAQWNRLQWTVLESKLQAVRKSLLREDADATVSIPEDENPKRNQERAKLPQYLRKYGQCRRRIAIHKALAPILSAWEKHGLDLSSIPQFHLQELRQHVNSMENSRTKNYLRSFFSTPDNKAADSGDLPDEAVLQTGLLQDALSKKLCVTDLQEKIFALLRSWSDDVHPGGRPSFTEFCLPLETHGHQDNQENAGEHDRDAPVVDTVTSSGGDRILGSSNEQKLVSKKNTRKVQKMRHASHDLRQAVTDPLVESYSVAERANRHHQSEVPDTISSGHGREPYAQNNDFADDDDDDDEKDYDDGEDNNKHRTDTATTGRKTDSTRRKLFKAKPSSPKASRHIRNEAPSSSSSSSENDDDAPPAKKQKRSSNDGSKHERTRTGMGNNAKKKSARQEVWTDSPGANSQPVRLSDLPGGARASESKPQQSKKRRFFTPEEKEALRKGVAKYGTGNWKDILADYSHVFVGRTSVNIKDLHRTMLKNGEI